MQFVKLLLLCCVSIQCSTEHIVENIPELLNETNIYDEVSARIISRIMDPDASKKDVEEDTVATIVDNRSFSPNIGLPVTKSIISNKKNTETKSVGYKKKYLDHPVKFRIRRGTKQDRNVQLRADQDPDEEDNFIPAHHSEEQLQEPTTVSTTNSSISWTSVDNIITPTSGITKSSMGIPSLVKRFTSRGRVAHPQNDSLKIKEAYGDGGYSTHGYEEEHYDREDSEGRLRVNKSIRKVKGQSKSDDESEKKYSEDYGVGSRIKGKKSVNQDGRKNSTSKGNKEYDIRKVDKRVTGNDDTKNGVKSKDIMRKRDRYYDNKHTDGQGKTKTFGRKSQVKPFSRNRSKRIRFNSGDESKKEGVNYKHFQSEYNSDGEIRKTDKDYDGKHSGYQGKRKIKGKTMKKNQINNRKLSSGQGKKNTFGRKSHIKQFIMNRSKRVRVKNVDRNEKGGINYENLTEYKSDGEMRNTVKDYDGKHSGDQGKTKSNGKNRKKYQVNNGKQRGSQGKKNAFSRKSHLKQLTLNQSKRVLSKNGDETEKHDVSYEDFQSEEKSNGEMRKNDKDYDGKHSIEQGKRKIKGKTMKKYQINNRKLRNRQGKKNTFSRKSHVKQYVMNRSKRVRDKNFDRNEKGGINYENLTEYKSDGEMRSTVKDSDGKHSIEQGKIKSKGKTMKKYQVNNKKPGGDQGRKYAFGRKSHLKQLALNQSKRVRSKNGDEREKHDVSYEDLQSEEKSNGEIKKKFEDYKGKHSVGQGKRKSKYGTKKKYQVNVGKHGVGQGMKHIFGRNSQVKQFARNRSKRVWNERGERGENEGIIYEDFLTEDKSDGEMRRTVKDSDGKHSGDQGKTKSNGKKRKKYQVNNGKKDGSHGKKNAFGRKSHLKQLTLNQSKRARSKNGDETEKHDVSYEDFQSEEKSNGEMRKTDKDYDGKHTGGQGKRKSKGVARKKYQVNDGKYGDGGRKKNTFGRKSNVKQLVLKQSKRVQDKEGDRRAKDGINYGYFLTEGKSDGGMRKNDDGKHSVGQGKVRSKGETKKKYQVNNRKSGYGERKKNTFGRKSHVKQFVKNRSKRIEDESIYRKSFGIDFNEFESKDNPEDQDGGSNGEKVKKGRNKGLGRTEYRKPPVVIKGYRIHRRTSEFETEKPYTLNTEYAHHQDENHSGVGTTQKNNILKKEGIVDPPKKSKYREDDRKIHEIQRVFNKSNGTYRDSYTHYVDAKDLDDPRLSGIGNGSILTLHRRASRKRGNKHIIYSSHKGCKIPSPRKTVEILCKRFPSGVVCYLYCAKGHTLPEGIFREVKCLYETGRWSQGFDECKPFVDCTLKLDSAGTISCVTNTARETYNCRVSCYRDGPYPALKPRTYRCDAQGRWHPHMPHCVIRQGIDLVDPPDITEHKKITYP